SGRHSGATRDRGGRCKIPSPARYRRHRARSPARGRFWASSGAVAKLGDTRFLGTVVAAIEGAVLLEPVPNDAAGAMRADRRERRNGPCAAVEGPGPPVAQDLKRLVILVPALVTDRHEYHRQPSCLWNGAGQSLVPAESAAPPGNNGLMLREKNDTLSRTK